MTSHDQGQGVADAQSDAPVLSKAQALILRAERLAQQSREQSPARTPSAAPSSAAPHSPSAYAAAQISPTFPLKSPYGTAGKLRQWQQEAFDLYMAKSPQDFMAVATPGAGKTTFALRIAAELLNRGEVRKLIVVAPTEHLKRQWADAAARVGISLDPQFKNAQVHIGSHYDGAAITYAQVGMDPKPHERMVLAEKTLVILDEIHHAGDALSWGDGVKIAFEHASRRLALTGTPFRSDTNPIPFVRYGENAEGLRQSMSDFQYGYAQALSDGVVRPVMFLSYTGDMRWRTRQGDEMSAKLGEPVTKDITAQAWRTALDAQGQWMPAVLNAANKRLTEVRRAMPDAGAMVIATDQTKARAYAKLLRELTGEGPTVVLSDDEGASDKIEAFAASKSRWLVAVRMVSEGVDVPRLAVGVYATSTSTPLFFAQVVGRFVRTRKRGETASVFLPSVPLLMELATGLEQQRDHVLDRPQTEDWTEEGFDDAALEEANREEKASGEQMLMEFEAMESQATFDRVLFDGSEFGTEAEVGSTEEQDYLGIPGLLEPDQVRHLLKARQAHQVAKQKAESDAPLAARKTVDHRQIAELRKELNQLVSGWARKTGQPHALIHSALRKKTGGPAVPQADAEQLEARIHTVRLWFVGKKA